MLIERKIKFIWHIYGNNETPGAKALLSKFKKAEFKGMLHPPPYKKYDYTVQLSDTEGFSYTMYESISKKVPVIVTDFPSAIELVEEGTNGFILKKDLSNVDFSIFVKANVPKITTFNEKASEKDWIDFLEADQ